MIYPVDSVIRLSNNPGLVGERHCESKVVAYCFAKYAQMRVSITKVSFSNLNTRIRILVSRYLVLTSVKMYVLGRVPTIVSAHTFCASRAR